MAQQVYATSTLGGYWSNPYLTERLRHVAQPLFRLRQFVDAKEAIGKGRGDTFLFDKSGNVATQGGTLVETNTIPETTFVTNQGTATITEYGNAIAFTHKLQVVGQWSIDSVAEQKLRDDHVKVLESACGTQYSATDFYAVCVATNSVAMTTNGTATATATADLSAANIRYIVDWMKKKLIPKYDGQNYICVASTAALSGMHADVASGGWVTISQYTAERVKQVFNGEVGEYYGVKFVEELGGFLSNTIGSTSIRGQAVIFGADSVYEAVAVPEEIRHKVSADYGRDLGTAWYALLGFKTVWSYSADTEQHIVFVTSA